MSVAPSQAPSVSNQPSISFIPSISTRPSISTKPSLSRIPSIEPSLTKLIFNPVPSQDPTESNQCLWYPDFSPGVNRCQNDCNEPYYMRDSISLPRSRSASGHWYVDWNKYFCVKKFPVHSSIQEVSQFKNDPESPAYVGHAMFWEHEHNSLQSCCAEMLGHQDNRLCVQDSIDGGQDHYTYLWYVNARSQTCERDCPRALDPEQCDGHPYDITVTIYDNPETCCKERLSWLDPDKCVEEAFPSAAGRKFIDDSNPWFFTTNEECCEAHFLWDQECFNPPVDDEETLWYPDCSPGATRCLDDGNQPHHFGRNALNWLYRTYEECCATHFSWALNECANIAEGDSNHPSQILWYPDCSPGATRCRDDGNQPAHFERDKLNWLYKTPGECCNTHFSWALGDCVNSAEEENH